LWAIELALKSQAISLVIAACPNISRQTTQRLAISARKYSTTALLLRSPDQITIPSHASSRWEVSPTPANNSLTSTQSPCWSLRLCKLKGAAAKGQSWIVSINEPNPLLHSREPFSGYRAPTKHSETRTGLKSIFCSG
jgi:hypothetical protein